MATGNSGMCIGFVLLENGTTINVLADKSCKIGPPELGGDQLTSFQAAKMAGSSMVVAVGRNVFSEGKIGGNIDMAFISEDVLSMLPI